MHPMFGLGFTPFANFPGKQKYFLPFREIVFVCIFVSFGTVGFKTVELTRAVYFTV